jgi:hypothetical protein
LAAAFEGVEVEDVNEVDVLERFLQRGKEARAGRLVVGGGELGARPVEAKVRPEVVLGESDEAGLGIHGPGSIANLNGGAYGTAERIRS